MQRTKLGIRVACAALLWVSYNWNAFRIPLIRIDVYSNGLVVRRILLAFAISMTLMVASRRFVHRNKPPVDNVSHPH